MMRCYGRKGTGYHSERMEQNKLKRISGDGSLKQKAAGMITSMLTNKRGMEMVQVAILIALAVALGIIFRTEITKFVNNTFSTLNS